MSTLGNILWFLCGGFISAFLWSLPAVIMFFSIIGIPWVRSCLVIAQFNLCMFEKELIKHSELSGKHNLGNTFAAFNKKLAQHCFIYKRQIKAIKELPKKFLFKI